MPHSANIACFCHALLAVAVSDAVSAGFPEAYIDSIPMAISESIAVSIKSRTNIRRPCKNLSACMLGIVAIRCFQTMRILQNLEKFLGRAGLLRIRIKSSIYSLRKGPIKTGFIGLRGRFFGGWRVCVWMGLFLWQGCKKKCSSEIFFLLGIDRYVSIPASKSRLFWDYVNQEGSEGVLPPLHLFM